MDLQEHATLFNFSCRLGSAAEGLKKLLMAKEELSEGERQALEYTGNMVGAVDEKSPHHKNRKVGFDACHTTTMRAILLKKLVDIGYNPSREFWEQLYQTARTGGKEMHLSMSHAQKAYQLINEISDDILTHLQQSRRH